MRITYIFLYLSCTDALKLVAITNQSPPPEDAICDLAATVALECLLPPVVAHHLAPKLLNVENDFNSTVQHVLNSTVNATMCVTFCYTKTILLYQYKAALNSCILNGCYGPRDGNNCVDDGGAIFMASTSGGAVEMGCPYIKASLKAVCASTYGTGSCGYATAICSPSASYVSTLGVTPLAACCAVCQEGLR